MMKKLLSVLLALCMIFSMFIFPANAVEEGTNEEVAKVTFTYADERTEEVDANKDEPIEYPVLVAENRNNMYDAVWSLSADEYDPVPEVSDGKALTVYEFRRTDKQSFESYNQEYELVNNKWLTNAMVTDEEACEGSKSMKYENTNMNVLTDAPANWATNWTDYYTYDAGTDEFTQLSGNTAPNFENGKYYIQRASGEKDQGMFMVKGLGPQQAYTYSYKITFKYYVPKDMAYDVKILTRQISTSNFWASGGIQDLGSTFVIPKTATNGWQTGELYVSANELTAAYGGQVIAFKVDTAVVTGANARDCVVYFDDITTTEQVTFTYKNGTTSKVDANKDAPIEYPVLVAEDVNNMYDAVWSLSADEYVPVPEVSDGKALTVYEFRRTDKQSFESYNQNYELVNNKWLTNAMVTDEEACEGSKSMKYENTNMNVLTDAPANWATNWTDYYTYDAGTDKFTQLSGNTAPDFENGKYYIQRASGEKDQGMFMVKGLGPQQAYTYSYKITFKYYVPKDMAYDVKISTRQISTSNFWASGGIKDLGSTFVIPKTATNGWKTGKLYVTATAQTAAYGGQVIAFKVDTAVITGANARNCVVYFDDVVCEDYTPAPTVIYHHNDGVTEDTVVTEGIVAGNNNIAYVPTTAPAGKYFMGWYTDEALTTSAGTTFNVPSSGIQETDLYAKWGNYADGTTFNLEGITDNPATGYAYMKDDVYSRVDGINETGYAYKSFTEDGVVLGKKDAGNAFKWDPSLAQNGGSHVLTGSASDLVAVEEAKSLDEGEQGTVGWVSCSNYIVKDANGNAVIAKPNTKYAVLMTYKVLQSGPVDLYIGMGRKDEYLATGANDKGALTYNSYISDAFTIGTDKLTGETDTFTYYIDTSDFSGVAPVVSIHCVARGYLGERLADDGNDCASYEVDGVTYYPHRIVSVPKVAIKEIALIEIENDNPVVTYKYYEEGEGFSAVIKDAPVGSDIDVPTNNVDPNWYSDKAVQSIENISKYPSTNTTLYNADYMMATGNVVDSEAGFFGTQFEKKFTEKDSQSVPAIYFNSVGYDEFMEGKNPAVDANINDHVIAEPDEATKLSEVKDHYGKSTQMFRMGKAVDGHTYKVSFSIKADKFEADMGVHFASGTANNIWGTTAKLADYNDITTSKVVAGENWYDFTYYVTYDAAGYYKSVAGMDDTKESVREYFYIWFSQTITAHDLVGCDNEIYITDIVYEDLGVAVGKNGASVLNDEAMQTATSQAMRFYFTYETEDGSTIKIGDEIFTVKERGFIYKNGAIGKYTAGNGAYTGLLLSTAGIKKSAKTEGFENCWDYTDGTMTFSTYVKGFTQELYDNKLIVRGYVTFADASGKLHTVYSDTVNRSVNGISDYHAAK